MLNILIILTIVCFIIIGVMDIITATIPHTSTIILLILGILYCIFDKNIELYITLILFFTVLITQIMLFAICGENNIGGGDVKILSISMLFIHNLEDMLCYLIVFSIVIMFGFIISKLKNNDHLRLGPYMSIPIIYILIYESSYYLLIISLISLLFLSISCATKNQREGE